MNIAYSGYLFAGATALVLLYVLLPLTRRGGRGRVLPGLTESPAGARLREIEEQRTLTIEALRDLEFEHRLGNLTDEDYLRLKERYTRRAISLLQQAESADKAIDDDIELAVRALRGTVPLRAGSAPRVAAATGAASAAAACAYCGRALGPEDRFCPSCGRPVAAVAPVYRNGHARPATKTPDAPDLEPRPAPKPPARRRGVPRWALASGVAAVVFALAVGAAYFALKPTAGAPTPVGEVAVAHVHGLMVSAGQSNTMFLSHHNGLYRSDDGGRKWTAVSSLPPNSDVMGMANNPAAAGTVILSGHNVLMRSLDGGATFAPFQSNLPTTDIHALAGHPDNPQVLYAYVADRGLYRSDNGGTGWSLVNDRLPGDTGGLAVMPVAGGNDIIFAATQGDGMLMSTDGGKSWTNASGFVNGALPTKQVFAVAVDPRSGDSYAGSNSATFHGAVYAGTDQGLYKSTDGGQSWNHLQLNTDVAALALEPADPRSIVAANLKGQVFRSPDRGVTWRPRQ
jgi:photosystem II stability/assembly factor-like uncharacterized protein